MLASTWRAWSEWTTCVRAVGFRTENKSRGRSCRKPDLKDRPPGTCAEDCPGDSYQTVKCPPTRICETTWLEWGEYGQCSETCGAGVKSRSRRCRSTLCICRGEANDTIFCSGPACLGTGEHVSSTPGTRGDADQHSNPLLRVGASSVLRTAGIVVGSLLALTCLSLSLEPALC
ncbi:ectin-like [Littorina saxatilis]|uniref:ectin-like n=1 Tax=Littorina saxatilis TaxID=31220 RepID=UPI0038B62037